MSVQFIDKTTETGCALQYVPLWGCAHCGKYNRILLSCSQCKQVTYCHKDCQRAHWKNGHKHICRPKHEIRLKDHVTVAAYESFAPEVAIAFSRAEQEGYTHARLLLPVEFVGPKISRKIQTLREQQRECIEQMENLIQPKEGTNYIRQLKNGGVMELLNQTESMKTQIMYLRCAQDRNAETNRTYVIRQKRQIVGFCVVVINATTSVLDLVHFFVVERMRRRGICKKVVDGVLKPMAKEMNFPITVDTDHAESIWRRMGFVFHGKTSTMGKKIGRWDP